MSPSSLVISSNSCESVNLAIQIKSSALAVHANIISSTLKAAMIAEQELWTTLPTLRVSNAELIKNLSCMNEAREMNRKTESTVNHLIWQVI